MNRTSGASQLSCAPACFYVSHRENIIYCYEPGVHMCRETYRYTTFPALFLSLSHLEISDSKSVNIQRQWPLWQIAGEGWLHICTCLCEKMQQKLLHFFVWKRKQTNTCFRAVCLVGNPPAPSSSTRSLLFILWVPVAIGDKAWSIPLFPLVTYYIKTQSATAVLFQIMALRWKWSCALAGSSSTTALSIFSCTGFDSWHNQKYMLQ